MGLAVRGGFGCAVAMAAAALCCGPVLPAAAAGTAVTSTPDDPGFARHEQWGLVQAGFPAAWCRSTGAGALVIVIDTGVDESHPDLAGKLVGEARVQNGVLSTGPGSAADDSGHGTHVAGIAVADTDNRLGVAGAAPDAKLYAIKVLFAASPGQPEQGSQPDLVQAIEYATDHVAAAWAGPVVLNISIGAADPSTTGGTLAGNGDISSAVEHAYARGLGVAIAAGNVGTVPVGGPAVQAGAALSVGALDQNGSVATYSPTSGVSVFAAGGSASGDHQYTSTGILSTWPHSPAGDYAWMAGTSMAAPHVSAALALLMSSGLSNAQAYSRLEQTGDAQHRIHVDLALGNTTPCGVAPRAVRAAAAPRPPARVVVATPSVVPTPAAASTLPPSTPVAQAAVHAPVTGTVATGARGSSLLGRVALALGAVVGVWLLLPRRYLLRVLRG